MSGVHTELKNAFLSLGVEAHIATHGDGWKRYPSDLNLGSIQPGLMSHLDRLTRQISLIDEIRKYDVIQLISPNPFYRPISRFLESIIFEGDSKCIYIAAGSDAIYRKHTRDLEYYPPHNWSENHDYDRLKHMLTKFDRVVPVCWEYEYCMRQADIHTEKIIPFPVNLEKTHPHRLAGNKKLKIFHPLNRNNLAYDFKGTLIIREAFERLEKEYGKYADFICAGGMTYTEYADFTRDVDIIVDQAFSYSYGMSAAYGLANGRVVLSGLESVARSGHYASCPIINIKPNVDDIFNKIEILIRDKEKIRRIGEESRFFAETFHCSKKVALQYLHLYQAVDSPTNPNIPRC